MISSPDKRQVLPLPPLTVLGYVRQWGDVRGTAFCCVTHISVCLSECLESSEPCWVTAETVHFPVFHRKTTCLNEMILISVWWLWELSRQGILWKGPVPWVWDWITSFYSISVTISFSFLCGGCTDSSMLHCFLSSNTGRTAALDTVCAGAQNAWHGIIPPGQ